jgi:hypothetical protein
MGHGLEQAAVHGAVGIGVVEEPGDPTSSRSPAALRALSSRGLDGVDDHAFGHAPELLWCDRLGGQQSDVAHEARVFEVGFAAEDHLSGLQAEAGA